jgi:hypothetical protein
MPSATSRIDRWFGWFAAACSPGHPGSERQPPLGPPISRSAPNGARKRRPKCAFAHPEAGRQFPAVEVCAERSRSGDRRSQRCARARVIRPASRLTRASVLRARTSRLPVAPLTPSCRAGRASIQKGRNHAVAPFGHLAIAEMTKLLVPAGPAAGAGGATTSSAP